MKKNKILKMALTTIFMFVIMFLIQDNVYAEKLKKLPNIGAIVKTEDGEGEVDGIETLKERIKVKFKTEN